MSHRQSRHAWRALPATPPAPYEQAQRRQRSMTARMYYDADADREALSNRPIAILGYGSQGHAHALNLRDSGHDVRVGLPASSKSRAAAEAEGLRVLTPDQAWADADVVMMLAPDTVQRRLYRDA